MPRIANARRLLALGAAALTMSIFGVGASPAAAQEIERGIYAGIAIGTADYEGGYQGVSYDDTPITWQVLGGYRLGDRWSVELGYQRVGDIDANDVRGSGTERLDISERLDMAIVRGVLAVPLGELFGWRRKISLFGSVGYHLSESRRDVLELQSLRRSIETREESGFALGGGARYEVGAIELRGYVERLNLGRTDETWSAGVGMEFRFADAKKRPRGHSTLRRGS